MCTNNWYNWFPGMGNGASEYAEDCFHPITYNIEIRFNISTGSPYVFTTVFTYYLGSVICTGHLDQSTDQITSIIIDAIKSNEERTTKAFRFSEYNPDSDTIIILERIYYVQ